MMMGGSHAPTVKDEALSANDRRRSFDLFFLKIKEFQR